MTAVEKARYLVNEKFYQPLPQNLNVNNNSQEMWGYAKKCAIVCVDEIQKSLEGFDDTANDGQGYWEQVKEEIGKL